MTNSPFHDPQQNPLPDANDIEQEATSDAGLDPLRQGSPTSNPSPHIKQDIQRLRNFVIGLLLTGLTLGCVVAIGVAFFLKRTGLADPPTPKQGQTHEYLYVGADRFCASIAVTRGN